MTERVLSNSKIRADSTFSYGTQHSGPSLPRLKHNQCFGFIMCVALMVLCSTFPNSSPSEMKKKKKKTLDTFFPASLVTQQLV